MLNYQDEWREDDFQCLEGENMMLNKSKYMEGKW